MDCAVRAPTQGKAAVQVSQCSRASFRRLRQQEKKKKEESDKTATTISHRNHDSRPSSSRPLFSHSPSYTQNITCKPIINQKQPNQPAVHSPIPPQSALSPGPRATASPDMHPCAADPRTPPPHPPSPLAARSSVPQPATAPHIPSERQAPRPA